ncbi:pheromone receptor Rcb3 B45 [Dendrothele bispora CBS 962.96]|uniref:Pheromone receptor Rcb3 B45 n=1 Tax=Dendrothele bispora (strain CBS 962.96) TaxID=1314807 RepID=A0A4S8L5V3_DENBC|nr:pheromone receptor Rcb3 B45 [Dendrothele bispora CBS 962.96]
MDSTYPLFPVFAFLGFFLPLIPLPWHFQAWNSGTCFFIFWTSLACLNQFVNSIVWHNNALNPAPVWCDISTRIMLGATVGIPASSLCINRRLYRIATIQSVGTTQAEKRRAVLIDCLICLLFPMIFIALQYVVQGHRFDILEDVGCYPVIYNTLLAYFTTNIWPIVIGLISATYCALTLRSFARRRLEFSQFMSSNKALTMSRYFRLMALAMTDIMCTTPIAIALVVINLTSAPLEPWRSWEDTHFAFSRVEQIPAVLWRSNHLVVVGVECTRWLNVVCSLLFFAFFGFADEARKHYRLAFRFIMRLVGVDVDSNSRSTKGGMKMKDNYMTSSPAVDKNLHSLPLPLYMPTTPFTASSADIKSPLSDVSDVSTPTTATATMNEIHTPKKHLQSESLPSPSTRSFDSNVSSTCISTNPTGDEHTKYYNAI